MRALMNTKIGDVYTSKTLRGKNDHLMLENGIIIIICEQYIHLGNLKINNERTEKEIL